MKKFLLGLLAFVVLLVGSVAFLLRYPQLYFREEWAIDFLKKQDFASDWTWKSLSVGLHSDAFLEYLVSVETEELNASYTYNDLTYVSSEADIKLKAKISWSLASGLKVLPLNPLQLRAKELRVEIHETPDQEEAPPEPPQNFKWKELLAELHALSLPNLEISVIKFDIRSIPIEGDSRSLVTMNNITSSYKSSTLELSSSVDLHLAASPPLEVALNWEAERLVLYAQSPKLSLASKPDCKLTLTELQILEAPSPLQLRCSTRLATPAFMSKLKMPALPVTLELDAKVSHDLSDPAFQDVRLDLRAPNPTWSLSASFAHPTVSLDKILLEPGRAIEELLPHARAQIVVPKIKRFLNTLPAGYREAPAPLNAMDGSLELRVASSIDEGILSSRLEFAMKLKGARQEIDIAAKGEMPWDTTNIRKPQAGSPKLTASINKFLLALPRVSFREPLPSLITDSRIRESSAPPVKPAKKSKPTPIEQWTLALKSESPVSFRTSLLEDEFRFMFDLVIGPDGPSSGEVSLLPIKAEILRRPIEVQGFVIRWDDKDEPSLEGRVRFPLPEYEIFLKVEGPLSDPRTAFESNPPLGKDDIYAVLLFGRPMSELDPEGRQGLARVQQGLAQGFFSLSTLYLLAGTRIESVGFDPENNEVSAQLRLDSRHTVRVGSSGYGQGSVALRRSLGGGWYIESSAQEPTRAGEENTNFGLLLQRIIAY